MITAEHVVRRLEDLLQADPSDTTAALELAQLSILPLRDEEAADQLALDVLAREPGQPRAVLLHAYICLHYWIVDEKIAEAISMLADLVERGEELGAAPLLLAEGRRRLDPKLPWDVGLLRLSVSAEPSWTSNHQRLAWALHAAGDDTGAQREYEAAIVNVFNADVRLDPVSESFHDCFTSRTTTVEWLVKDRDRLLNP